MRKIFKIAQNELASLFYSPVAWLLLIIFALQCGLFFTAGVKTVMTYVPAPGEEESSLTSWLFCSSFAVFDQVRGILYLYIPLLTMGLMSREFSSGSVKLLYSSPLTSRQIIFGKYIAILIYGLVMVCVVGTTVVAAACWVEHLDIPNILTALLGIYLLIAVYAVIGLFMSCLTSYQIVAAISTLAVLAVLNFIGGVGQSIAFVRDITYWLSVTGRVGIFIGGLICSGDLLYFILVIFLFLTLAILKLQGDRHSYSRWFATGRYISVVTLVVGLGYFSSRPFTLWYYDTTATRKETLSDASQEIVSRLQEPLTITSYVNLLGDNSSMGLPSKVNENAALFRQYIRLKPDLEMKYVYYYKSIGKVRASWARFTEEEQARKIADLYRMRFKGILSPLEIDSVIDLAGEGYNFVRVVESGNGKQAYLRVFEDMMRQPGEAEISAALKRLTVATVPRVGFLVGQGERQVDKEGDRDYYFFANNPVFRYALINQGFDVLTLSLEETIPPDVNILVISDMRIPLNFAELEHLKAYLKGGGNLLILGEAGRQEIMNPLAELVGVCFMSGMLVQPSEDFDSTLLRCQVTPQAAEMSPVYQKLKRLKKVVTMPGAVGLTYRTDAGFRIEPILTTADSGCRNEMADANFIAGVSAEHVYPTLLALSRFQNGREQRVMVAGDADWLSNRELSVFREGLAPENYTVLTEVFRWLSYGEFPVSIRYVDPLDTRLKLSPDDLPWVKLIFLGIIPLLFVIGGAGIYWKRRKA